MYTSYRGCDNMSKYQMIYQELLEKIKQKKLKAGSFLPSEKDLMIHYNASRDTIRKALNLLLQNGYIKKNKGKASLVLDVDKIAFPVSGVTSFKELQKTMQADVKTSVHIFLEEEVSRELKEDLYMESGMVYHIERIRTIDGQKVIFDTDYLNKEIITGLQLKHAQDSLFEYIEEVLGLKISFARKEITVMKATNKDKLLLDMKDYDLLVCVKSYTYLEDATLFQYTISKHRPDKFRFVDFARRTGL